MPLALFFDADRTAAARGRDFAALDAGAFPFFTVFLVTFAMSHTLPRLRCDLSQNEDRKQKAFARASKYRVEAGDPTAAIGPGSASVREHRLTLA